MDPDHNIAILSTSPVEGRYINKEISWLGFNYRVLQEAKDKRNPLLARIRFLAIFADNLDEFFKVRIATLKKLRHLKEKTQKKLEQSPEKILKRINHIVSDQLDEFDHIFENEIKEELKENKIFILNEEELTGEQRSFAKKFFEEDIKPRLIPIRFNIKRGAIFLKDQVLYMAIRLKKNDQEDEEYAIMEVPSMQTGRFTELPAGNKDEKYFIFLEDIILHFLPDIFKGYEEVSGYSVMMSRDAKLDIVDDVSGSLVKKVKKKVKKRAKGMPAQLLYDKKTPKGLLKRLRKRTGLKKEDLVAVNKHLNYKDLFDFPVTNNELDFENITPLPHPVLDNTDKPIMEIMDQQDILLHHPYHSFDHVLQFIKEAAEDPDVMEIKLTAYRLAYHSEVMESLIKAAGRGKLVTVLMEIRARFDEESNIYWANLLQKAGANVIYGIPKYKVHAKICLVSKRGSGTLKYYAHLSTGNYNEDTAKIYIDDGYFTTDQKITGEVFGLFNYFINPTNPPSPESLLIAPFNMRDRFLELVNREIRNAKKGKEAWLKLKMNNLQDKEMIDKLYEANNKGVKIDMVVRGICSLVPGVKHLSENIRVFSIVDRYLEHSRVYIFANNGDPEVFLSSADWMRRKFDYRIETAFPVLDKNLREELIGLLEIQFKDNIKSRVQKQNNTFTYKKDQKPPVQAQLETYSFLRNFEQVRIAG